MLNHASQDSYPGDLKVKNVNFRNFRGDSDFPWMLAVINGSKEADAIDRTNTLDELKNNYAHLVNCDPHKDLIIAEIQDEVVGYGRAYWSKVVNGPLLYSHFVFLLPAWRGLGIRRKMLKINEQRLQDIARDHDMLCEKYYETSASDNELDWINVIEQEGYKVVRYGYNMVRPNLNDIPAYPLSKGLEIRPVEPDQYEIIWEAAVEAFRDHWGFSEDEWSLENLKAWENDQSFNPSLWKVAWDGNQVAGMVLNYINENENQEYKRKRGYTETICVRRPWRRRGLAKALIAESLLLHKSLGMTETAHGVDAENPNGALQLYENLGYQAVKTGMVYRKELTIQT
ncbi:MAG: GNAT family N-acetyltransferase [Anaerolineales bacterium]|nr:MAG: GNAT family N-acetyltransferase [Anaerolineales bacterium]